MVNKAFQTILILTPKEGLLSARNSIETAAYII